MGVQPQVSLPISSSPRFAPLVFDHGGSDLLQNVIYSFLIVFTIVSMKLPTENFMKTILKQEIGARTDTYRSYRGHPACHDNHNKINSIGEKEIHIWNQCTSGTEYIDSHFLKEVISQVTKPTVLL